MNEIIGYVKQITTAKKSGRKYGILHLDSGKEIILPAHLWASIKNYVRCGTVYSFVCEGDTAKWVWKRYDR